MSESEVLERYAKEIDEWAIDLGITSEMDYSLLDILARYHDEVLESVVDAIRGEQWEDGSAGTIEGQIIRAIRALKATR